ncbi:MAG: hypothetical protein JNG89_04330 [Planctomycetaceae bacterium]|nr:hypothetical protein [Planctomycetaceae bacterium]
MLIAGVWGCTVDSASSPTEAVCVVTAPDGDGRVILVSEAEAALEAGRFSETRFHVAAAGGDPVTLQLADVGCSCYSVRTGEHRLNIGDQVPIPTGDHVELLIEASPAVVPGIKQYWAELAQTDGSFRKMLTCRLHTVADIAIRPDVVTVTAGQGSTAVDQEIPLQVEQHVRCQSPDELQIAWTVLPDEVAVTTPERDGAPVEIQPGVWRCRWKCELRVFHGEHADRDAPCRLPVASLLNGRQVAEASCLLIVRRESGVQAPRLVHLGRIAPGESMTRRVQLRSLDGRAFTILSAESRNGMVAAEVVNSTVSVEHWLEVRASAQHVGVDDEVLIRTDHPDSPELRFPVRGLGPR